MTEDKKNIQDLIELVDILRGEDGCPWDKVQTHSSIKNAIVEESYEVLDAIEKNDYKAMTEELGDVLFQVIFHASIEKNNGKFTLEDIITGIYNKMVFRHPHVFQKENNKVETVNDVLNNWDEIKRKEKNIETYTDELKSVAIALPALVRANKIQNKAGKLGFDFEKIEDVFKKVKEELGEVKEEYKKNDRDNLEKEVGDLLFSCVNVARFLKINPEEALNKSTEKFINRFGKIEEEAKKQGRDFKELSLDEKNEIWENIKKLEK